MTTSDSPPALDIRDLTRMRAIITIEMGCTRPWTQIQATGSDYVQHDSQRWQSGPQVFIVKETHVLQVDALDLLHVRTTPGGGFRSLLSIHAHVLTPDPSSVTLALRHREHVLELVKLVRRLLATEGSLEPNTIYFPGYEEDPEDPDERPPFPPPPFLSFWIPPEIVAHACASHPDERSTLAALGWRWTRLPGRHGIAFGEQKIDEADAQLEVLSQSWAFSVAEFALVYLPRRTDGYTHRAITHVFTAHNDVSLLVLRTRLLLKYFSSQVATLARNLNNSLQRSMTSSHAPSTNDGQRKAAELNRIVDQAIRLDAEVAAFLASTWGRDVSSRDHLDILLGRLQAVGYLEADISHLTEQTRWLRESTQTLIDRDEHRLDQERAVIDARRQQSAHTLNWMLGVLTFVSVPLAAIVELFASDKLPGYSVISTEFLLILSVGLPAVFILPLIFIRLARWLKAKRTRTGTETHCD